MVFACVENLRWTGAGIGKVVLGLSGVRTGVRSLVFALSYLERDCGRVLD